MLITTMIIMLELFSAKEIRALLELSGGFSFWEDGEKRIPGFGWVTRSTTVPSPLTSTDSLTGPLLCVAAAHQAWLWVAPVLSCPGVQLYRVIWGHMLKGQCNDKNKSYSRIEELCSTMNHPLLSLTPLLSLQNVYRLFSVSHF